MTSKPLPDISKLVLRLRNGLTPTQAHYVAFLIAEGFRSKYALEKLTRKYGHTGVEELQSIDPTLGDT